MNNTTNEFLKVKHTPADFAQQLWDSGQMLLAAGRYVAARRELEAAERQAFFKRDAALLARIYLPLLEAARQIRQFCCDGVIAITPGTTPDHRVALREVFNSGGVWLDMRALNMNRPVASSMPADVPVETLRILKHKMHWHITTQWREKLPGPRPRGIPVLWTRDAKKFIVPAQPESLVAVLPVPGIYHPGNPHHAQARETLFLTFEALALGWLARQTPKSGGWEELALLRRARKIDPACETILMRMISVAQGLI
jgi:hypothetical protein